MMTAPFWLAVLTALYLALGIVFLSRRKPGYLWYRHTISELGETGVPHSHEHWPYESRLASFGLFLPVGVAMTLIALLDWQIADHLGDAGLLAACMGVGYLGAAFFPCDRGSPLQGSWRQSLHNLAGGVEYFGGTLAFWKMAESRGFVFAALGLIVLIGGIGLSLPALLAIRGLIQRVAEAALFLGLPAAWWFVNG